MERRPGLVGGRTDGRRGWWCDALAGRAGEKKTTRGRRMIEEQRCTGDAMPSSAICLNNPPLGHPPAEPSHCPSSLALRPPVRGHRHPQLQEPKMPSPSRAQPSHSALLPQQDVRKGYKNKTEKLSRQERESNKKKKRRSASCPVTQKSCGYLRPNDALFCSCAFRRTGESVMCLMVVVLMVVRGK